MNSFRLLGILLQWNLYETLERILDEDMDGHDLYESHGKIERWRA